MTEMGEAIKVRQIPVRLTNNTNSNSFFSPHQSSRLILPSGLASVPETDRFLIVFNEPMLCISRVQSTTDHETILITRPSGSNACARPIFPIGKHLLSSARPARGKKKDNRSIVFDDYADDKTPSTYLPSSEKNTRPI